MDKIVEINGTTVSEVKKKRVDIVGFAPSTRDLAHFNNPDYEIWVLNEYFSILPSCGANNITRWFELHQRETVLNSSRAVGYLDRLKASTMPIMMVKQYEDIPMSEAYPLDDIIKSLDTDYFTNSISYMVAYAIYLGYEEIGIYGVDMAQEEEYARERPSVEYFIGYARAKGIPVYIPPQSDICKVPYYYGFQEESASKMVQMFSPKINDLKARIQNDDFVCDEMYEHMDYKLKKHLFEYMPMVNKIKEADAKIGELHAKMATSSPEEQKTIQEEIMKIQTSMPNLAVLTYQLSDLLMGIWENNQQMKGAKKERLFLAGAENMTSHLFKLSCPYDA